MQRFKRFLKRWWKNTCMIFLVMLISFCAAGSLIFVLYMTGILDFWRSMHIIGGMLVGASLGGLLPTITEEINGE